MGKVDRRLTLVACLIVLAAWPFFADYTPFYTPFATEILIFSLFAISYNLSLGYTGMFSFGHAAFLGVGGYTTGLVMIYLNLGVELSLLIGLGAGLLTGLIMGPICLRRTGIYFAMISLALSQVFFYIAQMWDSVTGGHDGLGGIPRLRLLIGVELTNNSMAVYWFVLAIVLVSVFVLWRVVNSSFGRVLQAIRENEERARTCGYNTQRIKLTSFVISGTFSGLAGGLLLVYMEFFGIESLHWFMSGTVLIMALFGGTRTFLGPAVGAMIFLLMKDTLSRNFEYWQMVTGLFFVIIVLLLPLGILGSLIASIKTLAAKRSGAPLAVHKNPGRGAKGQAE
ncbi:MAG: branched-chain amino acid ABC transporter permease [Nitrospinota bacterium]